MRRRAVLKSILNASIGVGVAAGCPAVSAGQDALPQSAGVRRRSPFVEMSDGTQLFVREAGEGERVAVFLHGNGASSQIWQYQMGFLADQGVHCIAFDRRGQGRSNDPGKGFDFDTLADDLSSVLSQWELKNIVLISHSMGSGEIVRYLTRYGSDRLTRIVLVSPTIPFVMKAVDNPNGTDKSVLDQLPPKLYQDFPRWVTQNVRTFYGVNASEETVQWGCRMAEQSSLKAIVDYYRAITETDFRAELPHISVPTLIIHGDADQSAHIDSTARRAAALIPNCQLKVYAGAPHVLMLTEVDRLNQDLLEFINA